MPGLHADNMANGADTSGTSTVAADTVHHTAIAPPIPEDQYAGLAQAIAAIMSHTRPAGVDRAIAAGITQLWKELGDQANWITELEQSVSDTEDEVQNSFTSEQHQNRPRNTYLISWMT